MKKGRLFIISAPSGTGKSTVVRYLLNSIPTLTYSISYTTRAPRGSETNGREYHFVDQKTFRKLADEGFFAEWASVHGEMYGTPKDYIEGAISAGKNVILDIDVQGGMALKTRYPKSFTIFLAPPSFEDLKKRLGNRKTDSAEVIAKRLRNAKHEMAYKDRYDFCVINNDLACAVEELIRIIAKN